jgi:glutathione S-transferase
MGLYASTHPGVREMKGLHLFHFVLSNCSQRARLGLEEKGLEWESHHMNLPAHEHMTDEYQSINPNGVVPTLVHDGKVIIESNDILLYLDENFPDPPLQPTDESQRARMRERIDSASRAQAPFKVISHELVFRPFRKLSEDEFALYDRQANDRTLVDFLRDYRENGPAWRARVEGATEAMDRLLDELEAGLAGDAWLSGDDYGLADIAWSVNAHRLTQAAYPLDRYPCFRSWYEKLAARPSFDRAVVSYTP